ncbi:MAG: NUDIX hydrolase [Methanomassiliicoccales archaeon]
MNYEISLDIELSKNGKLILNAPRARLLEAIKSHGSFRKAISALGLEESEALNTIASIQEANGQGSILCSEGKELVLSSCGLRLLMDYHGHLAWAREHLQRRFRNPILTVDGILLLKEGLVLVRRGKEPFKGWLALPGGIVEYGETVEEAVKREIREETGLEVEPIRLIGAYSRPGRDPRGHFITLAFELRSISGSLKAGDDAQDVVVIPIEKIDSLAFDHLEILHDFLRRARKLSNDS